MPHRFQQEERVAMSAVREALAFCQQVQSQSCFFTRNKSDESPVGVADLGSQALICRALGDSFPSDPMVAEETTRCLRVPDGAGLLDATLQQLARSGHSMSPGDFRRWVSRGAYRSYADRFWVVDPVDGTKGFLRGEQYAVSVALIESGQPVVAVIGCPTFGADWKCLRGGGAIYAAVRDRGARAFSVNAATSHPLRVSTVRIVKSARLCESRDPGHTSHDLSMALLKELGTDRDPLRLHGQLKYALVASGAAELYFRARASASGPERTWDHAAGELLVTEAGGRVTDGQGEPLRFTGGSSLEPNRGVVASNGWIHDAVVEALQRCS